MEHSAQVIEETAPLGPLGQLLHKATLPRLGVIADLPNTQKQTQKDSQIGETKKHTSDERTGEISGKKLNEMEANN